MAKLVSNRTNKKNVETMDVKSLVNTLISFNEERTTNVNSTNINKNLLSKISQTAKGRATIGRTSIIAKRALFNDAYRRRARILEKALKEDKNLLQAMNSISKALTTRKTEENIVSVSL